MDLVIDCSRIGVWLGLYGNGVSYELRKEDAKGDELSGLLENLLSGHHSDEGGNLELADIKNVLVTLGPGSFTGIRAGIAFAEGLCFGGKRNLYGISTLQALAEANNLPRVVLHARANLYYVWENGKEELRQFDAPPETCENLPISQFAKLILSLMPNRIQKANYIINPYEKK